MKLYLDDVRAAPSGWTLVTTAEPAIELLQTKRAVITHISLDFDLGMGKTGYDVAKFMVENSIYPENIYIHSMNPVGAENMLALLCRYAPENVTIMRTLPTSVEESGGVRCGVCNTKIGDEYENALGIDFLGGYGMFFDDLVDAPERVFLCHACAHAFVDNNEWVKGLIGEPEDSHTHHWEE